MPDILYIIVPCYNEEEVLPETAKLMENKLSSLIANKTVSPKSKILFVNDGSTDKTWEIIQDFHKNSSVITGINLSRNYGHQNALLAGLMTAKKYADVTVSMDADLQDDIDALDAMLKEYADGKDIVYGVRSERKNDTAFKKTTALMFYRILKVLGTDVIFNHADCRLMSRKALEGLSQFCEVNLFLRGIVPMIGYKTAMVYYERKERFAGKSKYTFRKMLSLAVEGITSLSTKPMRIITAIGFLMFVVSFFMLIYCVYRWAIGATVLGWASILCSCWLIGGLILLALGVMGEYIAKIYLEVKQRPKYIIDTVLHDESE